jgi:hypothetical protein
LDLTWSSDTLETLAFLHKNGFLSTSSEDEEDPVVAVDQQKD